MEEKLSEWGLTSESPLGAPAILFSPDSIGLSEAMVGASSSYSPPRGIVYEVFFLFLGFWCFCGCQMNLWRVEVITATCWEAPVGLRHNCASTSL